jgi:hypothetical protein
MKSANGIKPFSDRCRKDGFWHRFSLPFLHRPAGVLARDTLPRPEFIRVVEALLRRVRLGDIVWLREEKYGDLLVWHVADVDGAMRPVTWLVPIDLAWFDLDMLLWTSVAEFNSQSVALEDDRYAVERVSMPSGGLARCEE